MTSQFGILAKPQFTKSVFVEGKGRQGNEFSFDIVAVMFRFVVTFVGCLFGEVHLTVDADKVALLHAKLFK